MYTVLGVRMPFIYHHHPRTEDRQLAGPVKVDDQHNTSTAVARFNTKIALLLTKGVGTMWCAYIFAIFDCLALPTAIKGGTYGLVQWTASFFLQLVLLSVIMVGQNVQGAASDKRAEQTYLDAEAVLQEVKEIQRHLLIQDDRIEGIISSLSNEMDKRLPANRRSSLTGQTVTRPAGPGHALPAEP
jgi:hypothetical protein